MISLRVKCTLLASAFLSLFSWGLSAQAQVARDGDAFSIDLGSTRSDPVCIALPRELTDVVACEGVDQSAAQTADANAIAIAFLRVSGGQIFLTVKKDPRSAKTTVGPSALKNYEAALRVDMPGVTVNKLSVAPIALDPAKNPFSRVTAELMVAEHIAAMREYSFFATNARYTVRLVAPPALGEDVSDWEKRIVPTVKIKSPSHYEATESIDATKNGSEDGVRAKLWIAVGLLLAFAIGIWQKARAKRAHRDDDESDHRAG